MIELDVTANLADDPWPPATGGLPVGILSRIGLLPDGTTDGQPVVALEFTMPDGATVRGQTSWELLRAAHAALFLAELQLHT